MTTRTVDPSPDLTRRHAVDRPGDLAVVDGDGSWTWAELDRRAEAIASALAAAAGPESSGRVALAVGPTAVGVAAIHGAARAGVTAVLVNPRLTGAEIGGLLAASGTTVIAVEGPANDGVVPAGIGIIDLATLGDASDGATRRDTPTVFVVATSGTTERPKLACLPLDRLVASATAWNAALPPATAWLLSLGLAHVAGLGIVTRAADAGVPIVIAPRSDPAGLLEAIQRADARGIVVSHASLVATQLTEILDATGDASPRDGLRGVILGGGPVPESLRARAVAAGWPVVESYGMTETSSGIALDGRPLAGVALRVAGDGEILVRGPMVFDGYLDDVVATDAAIDADGWLHTGDLGRLDDAGRLVVVGRRDSVIIRGGENVSPAEVEAALASHPGVGDVAVVGIPDPVLGEVVAAVVVPTASADPTDDDLRAHARVRLAGFKVPARIVRVRELPRTSLGKVARSAVQTLALTGERRRSEAVDGGQTLAVRELGADGDRAVVLLHATLSNADQLLGLGRRLADRAHVVLIDRRGSGASSMAEPAPVDVARHVDDVIAVLDALGIATATVVGHSFGGVVALETAVRHPARVVGVVAWEPPFMPLAPRRVREGMARIGDDVAAAHAAGGSEAAARLFFETVSGGPAAWERLHPRQREVIGRGGTGALADVAMGGLSPVGLERIAVPTLILTGSTSERFYRPIADAVVERIGAAAALVELPDLRHMAPITDPAAVAVAVQRHLDGIDDQETSA